MMNKNFALIALVLGFAVVNVEAKKTATVVAAPDVEEVAAPDVVAPKVTWSEYAQAKKAAASEFANDQWTNHKIRTIVVAALGTTVTALVIEAIVRREKCSTAQAYKFLANKLFGSKQAKYDKIAELIAAKQS